MNFKRKSKIQNMIDKIRGKKPTMKKMLVNNVINVPKKLLKRVDINIDGENNRIEISENARVSGFLFIKIYFITKKESISTFLKHTYHL